MRINYKTHAILEKLEKGSLGVIPLFDEDKPFFDIYGQSFTNNWKYWHKYFKNEINFVSEPFYEAAAKAQTKLMDLWGDIIKNDLADFDVNATYIVKEFVFSLYYETKKGSEDNEIAFFMFDKKGIPLAMYIDSAKFKVYQYGWISSCFNVGKNPKDIYEWLVQEIAKIILFSMFKTYADVEIKFLPANKKIKEVDCKYLNETKSNIQILDSTWFTTLVKSDAFKVRGHFRLQPCGEGRKERKLVWINDFEKQGYIRTFKRALNIGE